MFGASDRGPVAPGVLDELVGLGEPEDLAAALEPVVEDDGGDLAALPYSGAVAEHPAAAEMDGNRKRLVGVCRHDGAVVFVLIVADAVDGLPAFADPVARGEMAGVGGAGQDDGLELGVGEQRVGEDAGR